MKKLITIILLAVAVAAIASPSEEEVIHMDPIHITIDVHHVAFKEPQLELGERK